ncbi:MAG: cephalosporin hydroxylase family protein [Deltaproteobacteria bacterium]|jgi:cephalosporin hydroxylase|nr:cephalosporin hydroxylase family protein [Deltaproteobacteria bacterium]
MSEELDRFYREKAARIKDLGVNQPFREASRGFLKESLKVDYSYNFSWLGRPIIQYPQDIVALQEIIWATKPKLIVETGVAHGGTSVFLASMLELLGGEGMVLSLDIEIRAHNRPLIENHPLAKRIKLLEGDSIGPEAIAEAQSLAERYGPTMVMLDSSHTHDHVLAELRLYSKLVTKGCYLVVFDGVVEQFPELYSNNARPWGPGNNPLTATRAFLAENDDFIIDWDLLNKLAITAAPEGYLIRK